MVYFNWKHIMSLDKDWKCTIDDNYMMCFDAESINDFEKDIAMSVEESLLRISLIKSLAR